jgi:uncharacterized protein (TIGR00251 family)
MMAKRNFEFHNDKKGAALAIRVTPRASRNEISEIQSDGTVKIRLTAPPVEGKANEALVEFLAKVLDLPASKIEIVAGATGRDKLVSVFDIDAAALQRKILEHLA